MKFQLEVSFSPEAQHTLRRLTETLMAFADSIAKLQQDVTTLISESNPASQAAAVAAAVAAKDASDAAAVDAIDATVSAAIVAAAPAVAPPVTPTAAA